jgi:hypothetical protein
LVSTTRDSGATRIDTTRLFASEFFKTGILPRQLRKLG